MVDFRTVAKLSEMEPGSLEQVDLDDGTQVCLANVDGKMYAISGECSHMGGPLGDGELEGRIVTCIWHGAQFDVATGEAVGEPADEPVATYDVRIEGDEIQVATAD